MIVSAKNFPIDEHWAIIRFKKVNQSYSSDPREDYDIDVCEYLSFEDEVEMKMWIKEHMNESFKIIKVTPMNWNIQVSVSFNKKPATR